MGNEERLAYDVYNALYALFSDVKQFTNIASNSEYKHNWAFDKGLINQGVAEGCCSIGVLNGIDYCHPEYPKSTNGAL